MNKINEMLNVLESENIRVIDCLLRDDLENFDKLLKFEDFLFVIKTNEGKYVYSVKNTNYNDLEEEEEEYFKDLSLSVDVLNLYIDILNGKVEDCTEIIKNTLSYSEFYLLDKIAKSKEYKNYLNDKNTLEECYTMLLINWGNVMYLYKEEDDKIPDIGNYLDDLIETIKESKKYNDLLEKEEEDEEEKRIQQMIDNENKARERRKIAQEEIDRSILEESQALAQENKILYDEMMNYISNLSDLKFVSKKTEAKALAKDLRKLDINFMKGGKYYRISSTLEDLTDIVYKASLLKEVK